MNPIEIKQMNERKKNSAENKKQMFEYKEQQKQQWMLSKQKNEIGSPHENYKSENKNSETNKTNKTNKQIEDKNKCQIM